MSLLDKQIAELLRTMPPDADDKPVIGGVYKCQKCGRYSLNCLVRIRKVQNLILTIYYCPCCDSLIWDKEVL